MTEPLSRSIPKLFIMGTNDNFTSLSNFESKVGGLNGQVKVHPGDHFWFGSEELLFKDVVEFLGEHFSE
jgi:hypothetical protein